MKRTPTKLLSQKQKHTENYWLAGIVMASLLMGSLFLFGDPCYSTSDDARILRPFMGFAGAVLPTFHLYLHPIWVYPLHALSTAFPGLPWFSYLQLFLLCLSCAVSTKAILSCFSKYDQPLWAGLFAAVAYLVTFALTYLGGVTYTVTAAVLGAAAVLELLSLDYESATDGQIVRGCMASLLLVVFAYGLRQITVLPILAFCGLALLMSLLLHFGVGKRKKRSCKPLVTSVLLAAAVLGGLIALREWDINAQNMRPLVRWNRASTSVMDYHGLADVPDDLLAQVGWTREQLALARSWYFLDSDISTEAFETIASYQKEQDNSGILESIGNGLSLIWDLARQEPLAMRSAWFLGGMWLLCALGLALGKRGRKRFVCMVILSLALLLCFALLLYLGMMGQLPLRAALLCLLPAAAMVFGLLPICLPKRGSLNKPRLAELLAGACACAVLCLCYALPATQALLRKPVDEIFDEQDLNPYTDMDDYALDNPDYLVIYDDTLVYDKRMFPSTENGVPSNVMYWGGWETHSPEFMAQLAAFGIDGNDCDSSLFLREDVRLARGLLDPPPSLILNDLHERVSPTVDCAPDSDYGGVHVMRFIE